ncbi:MAG: hypothetical protein ACKV2O_01705 [Acidimicrobiales bacterium]
MKPRLILTLSLAAAGFTAAVAIPAGAYFQAENGSATGTAAVNTHEPVVLEALTGETPATGLHPGSTGEVILKVNNPNPYPLKLRSVLSSGDPSVIAGTDCTPANAGVTFEDQVGLAMPINPGIQLLRLPDAAAMSTTSHNSCQGASFALPVTITVETGS